MGAYHERFVANVVKNHQSPSQDSTAADVFVLRQYSKAISHLRSSLECVNGQESPVPALTVSAILVVLESFMGNINSAATHLHSCNAIFRSENLGQKKSSSNDMTRIQRTLARLAHQVVFYVDGKTIGATPGGQNLSLWSSSTSSSSPPDSELPKLHHEVKFTTLAEARDSLDSVVDNILQFFYATVQNRGSDREAERTGHVRSLERWSEAFKTFLQLCQLSGRELRGAVLLKIHALVAWCMLSKFNNNATEEPCFDSFSTSSSDRDLHFSPNLTLSPLPASFPSYDSTPGQGSFIFSGVEDISDGPNSHYHSGSPSNISFQLSQIVSLSAALITAHDKDNDTRVTLPEHESWNHSHIQSQNRPQYQTKPRAQQLLISAELGLIGPLYYAGLWTSDLALRNKILGLLEGRWRREGVWDSFVAAKVLRGMEIADCTLENIGPKEAAEIVLSRRWDEV